MLQSIFNSQFMTALGLSACFLQTLKAQTVERETLELLQAEEDAFQAAVNKVQDCVVQIETFGGLQMVDDSTVSEGPSSGTIVGSDGWIITSQFQFRNAPASITVVLSDGTRKAARVVATDHNRELVLLKIEVDKPLPTPKSIDRSKLQVGQWVIALGKTFDPAIASRSVGILSAKDRIWGKAIQADAKISPMNYGGPLIDVEGNVVGIIAPIDPGIATEGEVQQWYDSGIGFAIPLTDIEARLSQLQQGKDVRKGLLGFRPKSKDDFDKSPVIAGVIPGTPLAAAGFQEGDLLRKINGQEVRFYNHMRHLLGPLDAGQKISVTIERNGEQITKECELVAELPVYSTPFIGVLPRFDAATNQLKIEAIEKDGPADQAGLKVGDSIVAIGDNKIDSMATFAAKLEFNDYRQPIQVQVVAPDNAEPRTINVAITRWPTSDKLEKVNVENATEENDQETAQREAGLIELPFADIPNKVIAYVPAGPAEKPMGLLLLAGEPGVDLDKAKVVDNWQSFCRDEDFVLCVVTSASPQAWSMEELEVFDRAIAHLQEKYKLDERLSVVGGFGAGGTIAMVVAFERREKFRGLVFGADRVPTRSNRIPAVEPQSSLDILFGPENKSVTSFKDDLFAKGYRVESLNAEYKIDEDASSPAGAQLRKFLSTLKWY